VVFPQDCICKLLSYHAMFYLVMFVLGKVLLKVAAVYLSPNALMMCQYMCIIVVTKGWFFVFFVR
jgi:hypothetical protein